MFSGLCFWVRQENIKKIKRQTILKWVTLCNTFLLFWEVYKYCIKFVPANRNTSETTVYQSTGIWHQLSILCHTILVSYDVLMLLPSFQPYADVCTFFMKCKLLLKRKQQQKIIHMYSCIYRIKALPPNWWFQYSP